jgi:hypothetical protein
MEVNAVNSYGVEVHIVFDGSATGVENIPVGDAIGTQKWMLDGQLLIIRNGNVYDVTGARL